MSGKPTYIALKGSSKINNPAAFWKSMETIAAQSRQPQKEIHTRPSDSMVLESAKNYDERINAISEEIQKAKAVKEKWKQHWLKWLQRKNTVEVTLEKIKYNLNEKNAQYIQLYKEKEVGEVRAQEISKIINQLKCEEQAAEKRLKELLTELSAEEKAELSYLFSINTSASTDIDIEDSTIILMNKTLFEAKSYLTELQTQNKINFQDHSGYTMLHYCAMYGATLPLIKLVLDAGADASITSEDGDTAHFLTADEETREFLESKLNHTNIIMRKST